MCIRKDDSERNHQIQSITAVLFISYCQLLFTSSLISALILSLPPSLPLGLSLSSLITFTYIYKYILCMLGYMLKPCLIESMTLLTNWYEIDFFLLLGTITIFSKLKRRNFYWKLTFKIVLWIHSPVMMHPSTWYTILCSSSPSSSSFLSIRTKWIEFNEIKHFWNLLK